MTQYMLTIPRHGLVDRNICRIMQYIRENDIKKWIIGAETGASGYRHWQIRIKARPGFYDLKTVKVGKGQPKMTVKSGWVVDHLTDYHIEECSDSWDYEAKGGKFLAYYDTKEMRQLRFGIKTWAQEWAVVELSETNDREIMFWYDPKGNSGKTWLAGHLFETGEAYYVPPTMTSVQSLVQTVASLVKQERDAGRRQRPFLIIDIPRSWKWNKELYTAIETIKDGLLLDPRYSASPINCRGLQIMIMCNTEPNLDALSEDRWVKYAPPRASFERVRSRAMPYAHNFLR